MPQTRTSDLPPPTRPWPSGHHRGSACAVAPFREAPVPQGWGVTRESLDPASAHALGNAAWPLLEECLR